MKVKKRLNPAQFAKWCVQIAKWCGLLLGLLLYVDFMWMGKLTLSSTKMAFSFVCKLLPFTIIILSYMVVVTVLWPSDLCWFVSFLFTSTKVAFKSVISVCKLAVHINSALVSLTKYFIVTFQPFMFIYSESFSRN